MKPLMATSKSLCSILFLSFFVWINCMRREKKQYETTTGRAARNGRQRCRYGPLNVWVERTGFLCSFSVSGWLLVSCCVIYSRSVFCILFPFLFQRVFLLLCSSFELARTARTSSTASRIRILLFSWLRWFFFLFFYRFAFVFVYINSRGFNILFFAVEILCAPRQRTTWLCWPMALCSLMDSK